MQQVLDASQITGAGAWLLDQLPNMLDDLAIRFGGEVGRIEWPPEVLLEPLFTSAEQSAFDATDALLERLRVRFKIASLIAIYFNLRQFLLAF